jgi:murein DD-endopeptidase MepM/ murein hydrolase activator NlpD
MAAVASDLLRRAGPACFALAAVLWLGAQAAVGAQTPSVLRISIRARAIQPGEVVRLDVTCTCVSSRRSGTARLLDREIPLAPSDDAASWSGLIGLDLDTAPGTYTVTVTVEPMNGPPLNGAYTLNVAPRRFPTRRLSVAPVYVEPPPEEVARLLAEAERLDALFKTITVRERVGPFQVPVGGAARDTFGARSIFNGQARSPHAGVDFESPAGAPIAAPSAGVVVLAEDLFFTGLTVVLDHGYGLYSVLAHLSRIAVASGAVVDRGDLVGEVGATGRVTGPHLHWGVRLNGARVDPLSLLDILAP